MMKAIGWGYAFAIGASILYGAGTVLVRKGVLDFAPPVAGITLALLVGTLTLGLLGGKGLNISVRDNKRAIGFLVGAGLVNSIALISLYSALSMAPVVIVSPIANTSPLITLFCAHFFLQRLEKVTRRIVLGALLVVFGVILITSGA